MIAAERATSFEGSRSRRLPRAIATSLRHWATSGGEDPMREALRCWRTDLSKVALRSRRIAAFSLSAHSERLTNSKASGTSSTVSVLRAETVSALREESGLGNSSAVSLKRSKDAATLRPIAGLQLWVGGVISSPSVGVEEADAESSDPERLGVRSRDLADFGLIKGGGVEGKVTALDIGRFRRGGEASVEYPSESD